MPDVITSYEDLVRYSASGAVLSRETLFWIIEYNPNNEDYNEFNKYSLLRNECLKHPIDFKERLNNGIYKIWTRTPIVY